jgi:flagellar motor switch protein FliM
MTTPPEPDESTAGDAAAPEPEAADVAVPEEPETADSAPEPETTDAAPSGPAGTDVPRREPPTPSQSQPRWWRVGGAVREDVRTAAAIHERFARETAATLSRVARCEVLTELVASEWLSFSEYQTSFAAPATLARVELPGAPGGMIVSLDIDIGVRMLDRLLGGRGGPPPARLPTEFELELLGDVLSVVVGAVGEIFGSALSSGPQMSQLSVQPQLLRLVPPTESVMVLTYTVQTDIAPADDGLLTLCYSSGAVSALLAEVEQAKRSHPTVPGDPVMRELIGDVEIDLAARLQPSLVSAEDLRRLSIGDVLTLDHRRDHAIALCINDDVVLDGALGRRGRLVAVQVQQWRTTPAKTTITPLRQ